MSKLMRYIFIGVLLVIVIYLILNQAVFISEIKYLKASVYNLENKTDQQSGIFNTAQNTDISNINKNCIGAIEGSLMYPSEKIPDGMYVCARNIKTLYEYCTDQNIVNSKFKYQKGYRLEVPEGEYVVAGVYPNDLGVSKIDKGVEFKYTNCSGERDCNNKPLLVFQVKCNKTTENINLFDGWRVDFFRRFFSKDEQLRLIEMEK